MVFQIFKIVPIIMGPHSTGGAVGGGAGWDMMSWAQTFNSFGVPAARNKGNLLSLFSGCRSQFSSLSLFSHYA